MNSRFTAFSAPVPESADAVAVPSQTFQSVQAARALAALIVVLFHADKVTINPKYWHERAFAGLFACGHAGVEFFFVLSGFIIAHVHLRDIGRPKKLARFVAKRFDRIYPLYWLVTSVVIALAFSGPNVKSLRHIDVASVISSYLLLGHDAHAAVLTVSWTLYHEVLFYFLFALLIVNTRVGITAAAVWLVLIITEATINIAFVPNYVMSPLNLLFAAGMLTQAAVVRDRIRLPLAWAVFAIIVIIGLAAEETFAPLLTDVVRDLLYGIASAVGLAGIVSHERRYGVVVPRSLLTLGAASYSIYLVHFPVLSLIAKIMARLGLVTALPVSIGSLVLSGAVVIVGVFVHYAVERPLLTWLGGTRRRLL